MQMHTGNSSRNSNSRALSSKKISTSGPHNFSAEEVKTIEHTFAPCRYFLCVASNAPRTHERRGTRLFRYKHQSHTSDRHHCTWGQAGSLRGRKHVSWLSRLLPHHHHHHNLEKPDATTGWHGYKVSVRAWTHAGGSQVEIFTSNNTTAAMHKGITRIRNSQLCYIHRAKYMFLIFAYWSLIQWVSWYTVSYPMHLHYICSTHWNDLIQIDTIRFWFDAIQSQTLSLPLLLPVCFNKVLFYLISDCLMQAYNAYKIITAIYFLFFLLIGQKFYKYLNVET